jgi:hypothetical protein
LILESETAENASSTIGAGTRVATVNMRPSTAASCMPSLSSMLQTLSRFAQRAIDAMGLAARTVWPS